MSKKFLIFLSLLLVAAGVLGRFIPHSWNMTPITAIALFSSVYLGIRYSLLIVAATMLISDLFLGFYDWRIMLSVYTGFAVAALIGVLIKKYKNPLTILLGAASSSVFFFLLTNWAVWQFGAMYERSFAGLMESYTLALPFFRNMLLGDIAYTAILFGSFELISALSRKFRLGIFFQSPVSKKSVEADAWLDSSLK